ncbi:MAG: DUF1826 domain-containing protein [Pseudomonadota bacterium]
MSLAPPRALAAQSAADDDAAQSAVDDDAAQSAVDDDAATAAADDRVDAGLPAGVDVVDGPEGFEAIRRPDCAAVLWPRRAPEGVSAWIEALPPRRLPSGRVHVPADRAGQAAAGLADAAGMPDGPGRDWLVADVQRLASAFAAAMGAGRLRLRFDAVSGDACRKFHVDSLTARLICTYRGSGTQFGTSPNLATRAEPPVVFAAPLAAPLLLRGTRWPETPASGLLHRSPPIEGTGETRLLLVLDPAPADETAAVPADEIVSVPADEIAQ